MLLAIDDLRDFDSHLRVRSAQARARLEILIWEAGASALEVPALGWPASALPVPPPGAACADHGVRAHLERNAGHDAALGGS